VLALQTGRSHSVLTIGCHGAHFNLPSQVGLVATRHGQRGAVLLFVNRLYSETNRVINPMDFVL
jgi:hypothetical protein